jgi:prepilin peptidase CpaA
MWAVTAEPLRVAALALALAACLTDLRWRRVPNLLTFGAVAVALLMRLAMHGITGLPGAVLGWTVGLAMLLPLFALRGLGGGDVKLLAAFGAFVGPRMVLWTGLYGAIAGGVLAVIVTTGGGVLGRTMANLGLMLSHWRVAGLAPVDGLTLDNSTSIRLPYAFPLACGLVMALWLKA